MVASYSAEHSVCETFFFKKQPALELVDLVSSRKKSQNSHIIKDRSGLMQKNESNHIFHQLKIKLQEATYVETKRQTGIK
jgi:hypothetical protein